MKELIKQAESMSVYYSFGRMLVLRPYERRFKAKVENKSYAVGANFKNTGLALCGVLVDGQTLGSFRKQWIELKLKDNDNTEDLFLEEKNELCTVLGWMDYDHMMVNSEAIVSNFKTAINLLFDNKGLEMPFEN
jgi:hypothetical protein